MNKRSITAYLAAPWQMNNGVMESPCTLMVEGVHHGNHGPLYWAAHVLRAAAAAWEGAPVSLNHPQVDGQMVSINHSPAVWARYAIGRVTRPYYDPQKKALRATIQIPANHPQAAKIQGLKEVSVGVFSEETETYGDWQGEAYSACAITMQPDHLAILADGQKGACAWEDSCGIRVNRESLQILQAAAMTALNHLMKGEFSMTEPGTLLPPGVVDEEKITANELAENWEGFEGLPPAEILALTTGPRTKAKGDDDDNRLLPPGVS